MRPAFFLGNTFEGIFVENASMTEIGSPGAGNIISANGASGIKMLDTAATGTVIQGNRIGVNLADAPMGNTADGVLIDRAAMKPRGKAPGAGEGNTIARAMAGRVLTSKVRQAICFRPTGSTPTLFWESTSTAMA